LIRRFDGGLVTQLVAFVIFNEPRRREGREGYADGR